jgi:hypothetical protein
MADEDEKKPDFAVHSGRDATSPYPLSRLAPAFALVDVAREIAVADERIASLAGTQLELIAEQIRALQKKAQEVLAAARRDAELHRVESRFAKKPGGVYHLYRRADGRSYFSMLSPADWGGAPPHAYEGSYRLEADLSFSPGGAAPRERTEIARRLLGHLLEPEEES